ncbi:family 61 glycoside hydrolase [Amylocarpus encephaloides]|uniref:lytic cellulose monooxygenase (C4-dehydrogenating) n=1 Tax=Amylocarpus encephaloides TaxID=45428 RepID=A0A9P7YMI3_9HELO|nr:family 61 glycoside hydrolase [Amylocarpus encephaloides]
MKIFPTLLCLSAAAVDVVSAHYRFMSLTINGTKTADYQYVRQNNNYQDPIEAINNWNMRCNAGALQGLKTKTAQVEAGQTLGFSLDRMIFHPGPLQTWISRSTVPDVSQYDGSGEWVKIQSDDAKVQGTVLSWPNWYITEYNFTLPASIAPGQYLIRAEHIGLHLAQEAGRAQFFVSCAQVQVTGSGTNIPTGGIRIPGDPVAYLPRDYQATDPGIMLDINHATSYTAPGPAVWTG